MAFIYQIGIGTDQNYQKALDLYKKSAAQNHPDAQFSLAHIYQTGQGTLQNLKKSFELFQQAATTTPPPRIII